MIEKGVKIASPQGRVGVLIPGLGAVSTTFIAGVMSIRRGLSRPFGSMTQMDTIRLGKRTEKRSPLVKEFLPLAGLDQLVFGGWDIFEDTAYESAVHAGVVSNDHLLPLREEMEAIRPMPAVFDRRYVKKLDGPNVKKAATKWDLAQMVIEDIQRFKTEQKCDRLVMIWCGSTEIYMPEGPVHASLEALEAGLKNNDPDIPSSMIYAYAAIKLGIPYANGAPNLCVDTIALEEMAKAKKTPICGKDFKTGQTLMKTIIAPGLKARMLGVSGWFSANILGNRDGEVLDDPESFMTKEISKLGVLEHILRPDLNAELYGNLYHKVRIHYYPPRGDNKEGWDNIDIFGWMGYPMQIKIDFLCRDSILAAPIVLDLVLLLDLAGRCGMHGIQEWLSFFFKSPHHLRGLYPEHDLFIQKMKLKNTMRYLMGEEQITHLGLEYYD
ncbi:MAG TPA: inositol-3-phosphate synthase [Acidobacteriota bacterium]|nr:inositol-3-phosphate synthase [Acidobacteriota bacterium]HQM63089.1 inositol-3-phosphate synthase [Acidobacteriota bacterium]